MGGGGGGGEGAASGSSAVLGRRGGRRRPWGGHRAVRAGRLTGLGRRVREGDSTRPSDQTDQSHGALDVPGAPADGLGDEAGPGQTQKADGQIAQRRHPPGAVALTDLAAILIVDHVSDPMESILNDPVASDQIEQTAGVCLGRAGPARQSVDDFFPRTTSVQLAALPLETENHLSVRKIQVVAQLIADAGLSSLDPSMALVPCLGLRGEKTPNQPT